MVIPSNSNYGSYYFSDFTRNNYRCLIRLALEKYTFRTYDDYLENESFVIWRHDIDSSINSACKLARIEAEEGISAYYFIHLHNVFYNPLEKEMSNMIRKILSYGHKIGLHFDLDYYDIRDESALDKWLRFEADILARIFDVRITTFSLHNPSDTATTFLRPRYAGQLNVSSSYFREKVGYCSDSNGYWRRGRLEDILQTGNYERIQILTHPEWWQEEAMSPKERICRCIDGRAVSTKQWYDAVLAASNRINIDWVDEP